MGIVVEFGGDLMEVLFMRLPLLKTQESHKADKKL
jgi:hypothetical protein